MTKYRPMHFHGYVVTHDAGNGHMCGNMVIVANRYDQSLASYKQLFAILKRYQPNAKLDSVYCGFVTESGGCKNCICIKMPCEPNLQIDGFFSVDKLPFTINC